MSLEGKAESKVSLKGTIVTNMYVMEALKEHKKDAVHGKESEEYLGCYFRTVAGMDEWINPPLILDEEYRTSERWNGKVVYAKLVDFGALPNTTVKRKVWYTLSDDVTPYTVIRVEHVITEPGTGIFLPLPYVMDGETLINYEISGNEINVETTYNYSMWTGHFKIWYIKD